YDSHIILLRLNTELIDPLFFVYFNNSKLGQKQIENIKSAKATKQTELGVGNLLKLQFPLPSIEKQREIVLEIKNLETQIEDLKIKSVKNSNSAITEFEEAIFSQS
ncbi:MAG: restriction endonuclease subunit S, partial [Campylobacteraceae bacterium]|nr:restriction endonuclease subunit S [Campylobacteraceae bacterium]